MNIHVPRSLQTKVELIQLTSVPTQVVSPQASKPVMGLVQDSLLGCYRFTSDKARLGQTGRPGYYNYDEVMHILQSTNVYTGVLPPPDDFYNPETVGDGEKTGKGEAKTAESESDEEDEDVETDKVKAADEKKKDESDKDKPPAETKKTRSPTGLSKGHISSSRGT